MAWRSTAIWKAWCRRGSETSGLALLNTPRSQYVALGAYDRRLCVREEVPQDLGRKPGYRQVYLAPAQTDLYGVPGPDRALENPVDLGLAEVVVGVGYVFHHLAGLEPVNQEGPGGYRLLAEVAGVDQLVGVDVPKKVRPAISVPMSGRRLRSASGGRRRPGSFRSTLTV